MNVRVGIAAAVVLTLAGCPKALPPVARPYAAPAAEELLAALRGRAEKIHAIDATAKAEESGPRRSRVKVKVQLYAQRPDRLRLELEAPLGAGAATLVTDGNSFSLLDTRENRFFTGAAEPCNIARLVQVELPPRAIVDALLGGVPLDGTPGTVEWDPNDGGREVLTLRGEDGASTRLWLDARGRVWDPVRAEHRDRAGAVDWTLTHAEFADHEGLRLPGETRVEDPRRRASVRLRYREQNVNPDLPASGFTLAPPAGLPVEQVGCN